MALSTKLPPPPEHPFEFARDLTAQRWGDRDKRPEEDGPAVIEQFESWAMAVPEPKVGRLNMARFPYQRELYSAEVAAAREVVIQKSTQVGVTSYAWRWAGWRADQSADTALYIFPAKTLADDFSDNRVDPSVDESEYLSGRKGKVWNKGLKKIGLGALYFRGSESLAAAQSLDADCIVFDEYDDLVQKNVEQMERRLSGAQAAGRFPRIRRVGVPRVAGHGINGQYLASDQRQWQVTCPACGYQQALTFEDNLRWKNPGKRKVLRASNDEFENAKEVGEVWRVCSQCEEEIDVATGLWVPANPGVSTIGFHITRLIVPFTDLQEVVRNSRKTRATQVETFRQNDLGEAYEAGQAGLDEATIMAACSHGRTPVGSYGEGNFVTMGVDVASTRDLTVRISEHTSDGTKRALWIGEVREFEDVSRLMHLYNVTMCAIDGLPERRAAMALAHEFTGRVFVCVYNDKPMAEPVVLNPNTLIATVNRTEAIDSMMDGIRTLQNYPLKTPPQNYIRDLTNVKRVVEVEEDTGKVRVFYLSHGPDDYAHAEVYDCVATHLLAMRIAAGGLAQRAQGEMVEQPQLGLATPLNNLSGQSADDYYSGFE